MAKNEAKIVARYKGAVKEDLAERNAEFEEKQAEQPAASGNRQGKSKKSLEGAKGGNKTSKAKEVDKAKGKAPNLNQSCAELGKCTSGF